MVTEDEIYVILGAMLLSGYMKLPNKRLYLSRDNDVLKILVESIIYLCFLDVSLVNSWLLVRKN